MECSLGCCFPPNDWQGKGHHARFREDGMAGEMLEQSGRRHQALRNHRWKQVPLIPFGGYKYAEKLTCHKKIVQVELKKLMGKILIWEQLYPRKHSSMPLHASWQTAQVLHFIRAPTLCRTLTLFEKHFINTDTECSSISGHEEIRGLLGAASFPSPVLAAVTGPLDTVNSLSSLLGLTSR